MSLQRILLATTRAALVLAVAAPPTTAAPARFTAEVSSIRGSLERVLTTGNRVAIEPGAVLDGVMTLVTGPASSAHLDLSDGVRLYVGPHTTFRLAPDAAPVVLDRGELVVENRSGRDEGPKLRIAVALGEVLVRPDGRVWIWSSATRQGPPSLVKVFAHKGDVGLETPEGRIVPVPPGEWLYAARWLPPERWVRQKADAGEARQITRRLFTLRDRSQSGELARSIPLDTLRVNALPLGAPAAPRPLEEGQPMVLTRADAGTGVMEISGYFLEDRLVPTDRAWHLAATIDGGKTWERIFDIDDFGHFAHRFTPQDGRRYQLAVAVLESESGRPVEQTPVHPVTWVEQLTVSFSDLTLNGRELPSLAQTIRIYTDELEGSSLVLRGRVAADAPVERIVLVASGDGGRFWKEAALEGDLDDRSGSFEVSFAPIPDAEYQFRVRARYAHLTEEVHAYQVLGSWDADARILLRDVRSTDRVHELVSDLARALEAGDARRILQVASPRLRRPGRDLVRAAGTRIFDVEIIPREETIHVSFDWTRDTRTGSTGGEGLMIFIKEDDWRLLDIAGDDPLSSDPPILLAEAAGTAAPPGWTLSPPRTVSLSPEQVLDLETGRISTYDDGRIPDDLAYLLRYEGDTGVPTFVTHDRRLVELGGQALDRLAGFRPPERPRYRSTVRPQPGMTYLLRTRQGSRALLEVEAPGNGRGLASRLRILYRLLPPDS